jgi:predicted O-linked N-acetylglucosamine transferase (SPINDLY family)
MLVTERQPDRALAVLDGGGRALADPDAECVRSLALIVQGRIDEALAAARRGIALAPDFHALHHVLLYALQHQPGIDSAALLVAHRRWAALQERAVRPLPPVPRERLDPDRRPVIGLVSGDLRNHAVAQLTIGAVEALARRGHRIVCFANQDEHDQMSVRFAAAASWHAVRMLGDAALAALIRRLGVDVLIDLAGHTGRDRLAVFAMRAAPLQGTWAGYVGTTGLSTMDFLIADAVQVPAGEDACYVERVVRLPGSYVTYSPPAGSAPLVAPPCVATGAITFGCFNRPAKLNAPLIALWARILDGVPDSRLLLRYAGLDGGTTRRTVEAWLDAAGLARERVLFEGGGTPRAMRDAYARVDVALDTQPYSGGVTTLEAVWMGVPVVTWRGASFAGRHGATHLHAMGLDSLIADDPDGYVARAIALARDRTRLAALRASLREHLAASPLCDPGRFADHFAAALRALWRERCGAAAPREHS